MTARFRRTACAFAAGLAAVACEGGAEACAVCQSGAPAAAALPAKGARGAVTIALDARAGSAAVATFRVDERRLELLGSYDFASPRIGIDAGVPLLWRTVSEGAGGSAGGAGAAVRSSAEVVSLGDVETRIRYLAYRHHETWLSLFAGVKWPTAPVGLDGSGAPLPSALQPGCSAIAPLAGASVTWDLDGWVITGVGQLLLPFSVREAPHPGDSVRLAATAERGLASWFATRASVSLRLETGGTLSAEKPDPNSGGAVLYVTTEAVFRPAARFSGTIGASFPAVQGWFGQRRESPVIGATVIVRL